MSREQGLLRAACAALGALRQSAALRDGDEDVLRALAVLSSVTGAPYLCRVAGCFEAFEFPGLRDEHELLSHDEEVS